MLHSTLSALLVSVASRYAQLSPSDVGIGIDGGRLVIDDVQLRAHTFNGPKIPFHVHEGRAGRLRINVPWSALSSTPVMVYLENVHLIAGPKQGLLEEKSNSVDKRKRPSGVTSTHGEWHQTMVGRLLFNVSIEIYGLKVEYRDDDCVGIISIASLRANSAGPDWNKRFVSLLSDLDPEQPEASAVSMRKLVQLSGVHWVMIPRVRGAPPAAEGLAVSEEGRSPRFSERHLDLNSYESKSPILDGIAVTVRVLMCTGMALVGESILPGLHAEIEVDLEESSVNLTAQQIKWIDQILKEGFGVAKQRSAKQSTRHDIPSTKRRPRSFSASQTELETESVHPAGEVLANGNAHATESVSVEAEGEVREESRGNIGNYLQESHLPAESRGSPKTNTESPVDEQQRRTTDTEHTERIEEEDKVLSEHENELLLEEDADIYADEENMVGGLRSFWQAIVGEYADETVDDAAVALGLTNEYTSTEEEEQHLNERNEDDSDIQYARAAVNAAAIAGGRTFKLRLKTPDLAARDEVEKLREELQRERERRQELEDVEGVLYKAEDRVKNSENEIRQLQERNASLIRELEDLENMTSQAGRNKDAMIRQMEAALKKAEKNLQAVYQKRYEEENVQLPELRSSPDTDDSSPKSIQQDSRKQPVASVDQGTEAGAGIENEEVVDHVDVGKPATDGISDGLISPHIVVHMEETAEAQASPTTQIVSNWSTSEELSIVQISGSEQVEENSLVADEHVIGVHSEVERQFGNVPTGMMTSKHLEQAMTSDGLTLV